MAAVQVEIRRTRRTDFMRVMALLSDGAGGVPPPDRATLRRFRQLVADLGADFYLAIHDGTVVGLLHVTYTRQLARQPRADIAVLRVAAAFRGRGIGSALLEFAQCRAAKRGCGEIACCLPALADETERFLRRGGLLPIGAWYRQALSPAHGEASVRAHEVKANG